MLGNQPITYKEDTIYAESNHRYRGNGMYEKCSSELERPYPSPNGKEKAYKLGEIVFLMEGSRRGT